MMPKGVEHIYADLRAAGIEPVERTMMPKGVEHTSSKSTKRITSLWNEQ